MTEKPIIFSGPMVRAILDGRKTQTRRVLKPQPSFIEASGRWKWPLPKRAVRPGCCDAAYTASREWHQYVPSDAWPYRPCDHLWVRETCWTEENEHGVDGIRYVADRAWLPIENTPEAAERWHHLHFYGRQHDHTPLSNIGKQVPSIHMPRWASRITLLVTDVRVQRVQDISEADAEAEGVEPILVPPDGGSCPHVEGFIELWNSIHGPGAWDRNDWVAAYTFERIKP